MERRFLPWMAAVSLLLGVMLSYSWATEDPGREEPSLREVVWRTVLQTLQERGLTIHASSFDEGRITTGFTPLPLERLFASAAPQEQERNKQWAGAEYRYEVGIGKKGEGMRVAVQAEIRAWEQETQAAFSRSEGKRPLPSNHSLEREFLAAFKTILGQGAAE